MTKTKQIWPKVEIGTHFAVMEYEDGTYEMYWDDEKLLEEVQEAISSLTERSEAKRASEV